MKKLFFLFIYSISFLQTFAVKKIQIIPENDKGEITKSFIS
jgi:hypothetical protein